MAETKNSYPTMPVAHWWKLREQFRKTIPSTVSTNYLASILGMSESSARTNILVPLRTVGIVDNDGKTNTEKANQFRSDDLYPKFCENLVKELYPTEMVEAFPDISSDKEKVKNWVMRHTSVGEAGANKIVAFYYLLLDGNPENKPDSNKDTSAKGKTLPKPKTEKVPKETKEVVNEEKHEEKPKHSHRKSESSDNHNLPSLNINIQIHISSDATPDQIEQIFSSMSKHLYKKTQTGDSE